LGERLPGAYAIAARVMNLTTQELGKQLKEGKILATDLIPKLSKAYQTLVRDSGALALALKSTSFIVGRLSEEYNKLLDRLGRGSTGDSLRAVMLEIANTFKKSGEEGGALSSILTFLGFAFKDIIQILDRSSDALNRFLAMIGPTGAIALTVFGLGVALLGARFAKSAMGLKLFVKVAGRIKVGRLEKLIKVLGKLKSVVGWVALFTVVTDFINFLEGKDSMLGDFLKLMFDVDRDDIFKSIYDFFNDIEKAWEDQDFTTLAEKILGTFSIANITKRFTGYGAKLGAKVGSSVGDTLRKPFTYSQFPQYTGVSGNQPQAISQPPPTTNVYHIATLELPNAVDGVSLFDDLQALTNTVGD
tara:strand:+ start:1356 stop:2435 length:1080 start_codon:yes stop_codon:yes gene_type:complete